MNICIYDMYFTYDMYFQCTMPYPQNLAYLCFYHIFAHIGTVFACTIGHKLTIG